MTEIPEKSTRKSSETRKFRFPSSIVMLEMPLSARAEPSIVCSDAGRQIDSNDEEPSSALASIRVSFDPDSNVNDESDLHEKKDPFPRNATDAGTQMNLKDEQHENDLVPISDSSDLNSNAIYLTDDNLPIEEELGSPKIRVIMRGITRVGIIAVAEFETDKRRTWNTSPPK
jgi:hypothetical protein